MGDKNYIFSNQESLWGDNECVGFGISLASIFIIFPLVGIESTPIKNIGITAYFTVISIVRGYVLRRWFNKKHI